MRILLVFLFTVFVVAPSALAQDCLIGNGEPAPQSVPDFAQGQIEFAYRVDPADRDCCPDGFLPEDITFHLYFNMDDLLFDPFQVAVLEAVGDPGSMLPGDDICATPMGYLINADLPGLYTLTLPRGTEPAGQWDCPCLPGTASVFLVFRLWLGPGVSPDPMRDSAPEGGRSFVRQEGGPWQDLVDDLGWAGELVVSSRTTCCDATVSNEGRTWGALKSIFR